MAAATAEEKEGFIEKISDQIESLATDVSSIETAIVMSDIDNIESINDTVKAIEKQNLVTTRRLASAEQLLRQILAKLN